MYKKSYKGFIIWLLVFCIIMTSFVFFPIQNTDLLMRVLDNACIWGIVLLSYIIYKTGYIYWYNGITYEEAANASPERRQSYARKHFIDFGRFALLFLALSIVGQLLRLPGWINCIAATVGLIFVAVRTIKYKL